MRRIICGLLFLLNAAFVGTAFAQYPGGYTPLGYTPPAYTPPPPPAPPAYTPPPYSPPPYSPPANQPAAPVPQVSCAKIKSLRMDNEQPIYVNDSHYATVELEYFPVSTMMGGAVIKWKFVIQPSGGSPGTQPAATPFTGGNTVLVPTQTAGTVEITAMVDASPGCGADEKTIQVEVKPYVIDSLTGDPGFKLRVGALSKFKATLTPAAGGMVPQVQWHQRVVNDDGTKGNWQALPGEMNNTVDYCAAGVGNFEVRASLTSGGKYSEKLQDVSVKPKREGVYTFPYYDHWEPVTATRKKWADITYRFVYPPTGVRLCLPPIVEIRVDIKRSFVNPPPPWTPEQLSQYLEFDVSKGAEGELDHRNAVPNPKVYNGPNALIVSEAEANPYYLPDAEENGRGRPYTIKEYARTVSTSFSVPLDSEKSEWKGEINTGFGINGFGIQGLTARQSQEFWATHSMEQLKFTMTWSWSEGKLETFKVPERAHDQATDLPGTISAPVRTIPLPLPPVGMADPMPDAPNDPAVPNPPDAPPPPGPGEMPAGGA